MEYDLSLIFSGIGHDDMTRLQIPHGDWGLLKAIIIGFGFISSNFQGAVTRGELHTERQRDILSASHCPDLGRAGQPLATWFS